MIHGFSCTCQLRISIHKSVNRPLVVIAAISASNWAVMSVPSIHRQGPTRLVCLHTISALDTIYFAMVHCRRSAEIPARLTYNGPDEVLGPFRLCSPFDFICANIWRAIVDGSRVMYDVMSRDVGLDYCNELYWRWCVYAKYTLSHHHHQQQQQLQQHHRCLIISNMLSKDDIET